jgi:radical SAM protein with 4Fe4S-binding SPASM domain
MKEKNLFIPAEAKNVLKFMDKKPFYPVQMDVLLTTRCNLRCRFCRFSIPENQVSKEEELSDETLFKVVDDGLKLGVTNWYIEGGEPLIDNHRFLTVIEKIKKYKTYGNLATNGTLFDESTIKKIIDFGWDEITFSIDSAQAEVHDFIRGIPGTFKKATSNIKRFQELKKKKGVEKPLLHFHSVITNRNYNKLDKIILLASRLGIINVNFTHVWKETELYHNLALKESQNEEFKSNVKVALKLANKKNIMTNLGGYIRIVDINNLGKLDELLEKRSENNHEILSIACYEPFNKIIVHSNGETSCCSFFCETDSKPDNVKNKNLKDIWKSKRLDDIRAAMVKKCIPPKCRKCPTTLIIHNEQVRTYLKNHLNNNGRKN